MCHWNVTLSWVCSCLPSWPVWSVLWRWITNCSQPAARTLTVYCHWLSSTWQALLWLCLKMKGWTFLFSGLLKTAPGIQTETPSARCSVTERERERSWGVVSQKMTRGWLGLWTCQRGRSGQQRGFKQEQSSVFLSLSYTDTRTVHAVSLSLSLWYTVHAYITVQLLLDNAWGTQILNLKFYLYESMYVSCWDSLSFYGNSSDEPQGGTLESLDNPSPQHTA